jgi:hypothetical protein
MGGGILLNLDDGSFARRRRLVIFLLFLLRLCRSSPPTGLNVLFSPFRQSLDLDASVVTSRISFLLLRLLVELLSLLLLSDELRGAVERERDLSVL